MLPVNLISCKPEAAKYYSIRGVSSTEPLKEYGNKKENIYISMLLCSLRKFLWYFSAFTSEHKDS